MINRTDLGGTRPPASVQAPARVASATDTGQEAFRRLSRIAIGSELQAKVLSLLEDGTHLVRLADTTARMALPSGIRAGDTLNMTLLARQPRPLFLLAGGAESATASLSSAGRLIDALLHAIPEGESAALRAQSPLLPAAQLPDPKQLASTLQQALDVSGLFYESHLQEWLAGRRSREELLREPQAQFGKDAGQEGAAEADDLQGLLRQLAEITRAAQVKTEAAAKTGIDALAVTRPQDAQLQMDSEQARMVGLQLNTLEQRQLRWQGELWPGQPFDWEVGEDPPDGNKGDAAPSSWTSTMRLELPQLGPVSASLRLTGDRVLIQIDAASDATAAAMRTHGKELGDALDAAGSKLDGLTIRGSHEPG
ncbi:flagellar hook-length control protein FliK [Noviherbaspirillum massiliense]|uniref:flagellar hook-length control protein FliK n=1 Tax=Noviherbaspirillum massiliense TaxID=1465823 RepID=UPI0002EA2E55|nr:flagellar hook-length control protein FliK [Noviherbaspirillum massiliense]